MSLTQAISSKANIKKLTSADVPYSPALPVLNKYEAASSSGQTVINLSFIVDLNYVDSFQLYVDGKLLRYGASNDYTFTSVNADNTSSQVTLTTSLPANLNIIAIKLGAKQESLYGSDNRFAALYDAMGAGFSGFVDENASVLTASSSMPAGQLGGSGVFRSSVIGRAPITDLGNDLKVSMGIERVAVQQITQLQNEFGPNGEPVWAAVNDIRGLIRFVGSFENINTNSGTYIRGVTSGDYAEIVFFGTGLNVLTIIGGTSTDYRVSVDGGAEGSNIYVTGSSILDNRNYSSNSVISAASNLSLGIHTIKIRRAVSTGYSLNISGFEILNESSTLKVNPGIAYIKGQKYSLTTAQSPAYNSSFESGALGTKGGRVLVYQKSDGSVAKAVTPTDASTLYLGSANHQNEEVIRSHSPLEFSASRTALDDFGYSVAGAKAFTLDDGTTTLVSNACSVSKQGAAVGISISDGATNFATITFIGTGLDIVRDNGGTSRQLNIAVDGTSIGSLAALSSVSVKTEKIVSGLPYGTHTVKIQRNDASTYNEAITRFIVYGPKKPSLPAGAVELADYNVMADFTPVTSGLDVVGSGVLRKASIREFVYLGSGFSAILTPTDSSTGWLVRSATNTDSYQYTFFGTGFDFTAHGSSGTTSATLSIDNVLYTGSATVTGTATWTPGTSTMTFSSVVGAGRLRVTGLALGTHTIKFTITGAQNLNLPYVDVITPIHSPKSNLYADLQNTLTVGNCAISDNRKTSAIKEALPAQKAWAQAVGVTANPTTNASYPTFVPCPDLSATITIKGTSLAIEWSGMFWASVLSGPITNATNAVSQIYVDGKPVGTIRFETISIIGGNVLLTDSIIVPVSPGTHKVDIYWCKDGAVTTLVASEDRRTLIVREL